MCWRMCEQLSFNGHCLKVEMVSFYVQAERNRPSRLLKLGRLEIPEKCCRESEFMFDFV